eukprot:TRINITY_DN1336_c0_g1_i1.p2 TRINITY_DN1336_c0_g1~~TRINITY_DN1336_c0_g1_i1.p2  ORF type:complete len:110 (-),score=13.98 TRINITY_DN1336_c0_g1_i1:94-423(-)
MTENAKYSVTMQVCFSETELSQAVRQHFGPPDSCIMFVDAPREAEVFLINNCFYDLYNLNRTSGSNLKTGQVVYLMIYNDAEKYAAQMKTWYESCNAGVARRKALAWSQ